MGFVGRRSKFGQSERKRSGLRVTILLLLVGIAGVFGYQYYLSNSLNRANRSFKAQAYGEAEKLFKKVTKLPFSKHRGHDGLAAIALMAGNEDQAKEHFKKVLSKKPRAFGADPQMVLERFLSHGDFLNGQIYRDFLINWQPEDRLRHLVLQFAAISLGLRRLDEGETYLARASLELQESDRYRLLNAKLEECRQKGKIPVVRDRNGNPLIVWDIKEEKMTFTVPNLFAGWAAPQPAQGEAGVPSVAGPDAERFIQDLPEKDRFNQVFSTLDLNLQRAAAKAMEGYEGTLLMMEPGTGEIRAAYGTQGHNPFERSFEPGSVVKVLTYGVFLEEKGDLAKYAPRDYPGFENIGGKIFYDWTTHGLLESADQGLAVSCNLMFAGMGIDVGWSRLKGTLGLFFDHDPHSLGLQKGYFGSIGQPPDGAWALGRSAIGLDAISATALGVILIPATVANGGTMPVPKIIDHLANFLGQEYAAPTFGEAKKVFSSDTADALLRGMEDAVYFAKGTARRARTDEVRSAMKTGTAGEKPYNSIMVGMLPAPQPKLVFSFFLYKGGKCEINGGRVAKALQVQIKALAPEYLE